MWIRWACVAGVALWAACTPDPPQADPSSTGGAPTQPQTDPTTGGSVDLVLDLFPATPVPVDVLFVVDGSGSGLDEQARLANAFGAFLASLAVSDLDYHIGVTSTTADENAAVAEGRLAIVDGELFLTAATADPGSVFARMVDVGTGGGIERGLASAYLAIDDPAGSNLGFYRDVAALHTVVVSDDPDQSSDMIAPTAFVTWYDALKAEDDEGIFSSVSDPPVAEVYEAVSAQVGGLALSIDDDWDASLAALGDATIDVAARAADFVLAELPVEDSIEVEVEEVDGDLVPFVAGIDWTYDSSGNSVSFVGYLPPPGATVRVAYVVR